METLRTHRIETLRGEHRYEYRGWIIRRVVRDWDARGYGGNGWAGPKITWETKRRGAANHTWASQLKTRRDACAFIDQQET